MRHMIGEKVGYRKELLEDWSWDILYPRKLYEEGSLCMTVSYPVEYQHPASNEWFVEWMKEWKNDLNLESAHGWSANPHAGLPYSMF